MLGVWVKNQDIRESHSMIIIAVRLYPQKLATKRNTDSER